MSQPEVRIATAADRAPVVQTIVAAFMADPAFRFFFRDDSRFTDHATAFAGYLFDKRVHRGSIWVVEDGASVALWDPPADGEPVPPPQEVRLELPADAMQRLDEYEAAVHDALPTTPHWYLGVLATHPGHAGRRWGRRVMAAGLNRAAEDGVPAYLETTNPGNVELYRRAGWEVTASVQAQNLQVWVMAHPGRASQDG